uniref:ULP_PROTEASE domain-containing protein n=1 Tax=Caenorhabditis tropicalis TaxID=1561998 RepID=A0A1I7UTR2_9PELO
MAERGKSRGRATLCGPSAHLTSAVGRSWRFSRVKRVKGLRIPTPLLLRRLVGKISSESPRVGLAKIDPSCPLDVKQSINNCSPKAGTVDQYSHVDSKHTERGPVGQKHEPSTLIGGGPIDNVLIGGGPARASRMDTKDSRFSELKIKTLEPIYSDDKKSIICRFDYPSDDYYRCHIIGCPTKTQLGCGTDDKSYMTKHMKKDHGLVVKWTYKCVICNTDAVGTSTAASRWLTEHLKIHGMKPEPRYKPKSRATAVKAMEKLNEKAVSLPQPKGNPKKDVMVQKTPEKDTVIQKTPEKEIKVLESKIQTRSVSKKLSAIKESVKKTKEVKKTGLASIFERSEKGPRRSLAPLVEISQGTLSNAQRVAAAREEAKKESRLNAKRRSSLAMKPGRLSERLSIGNQSGTQKKDDSVIKDSESPQKDTPLSVTPEVVVPATGGVPVVTRQLRFDAWCLNHETGVEAWFTDTAMEWCLRHLTKFRDEFITVAPGIWSMFKRSNYAYVKDFLSGEKKTYFLPVCENKHWPLIVIKGNQLWFSCSLGRVPEGEIERLIVESKKEKQYYEFPVPLQRDSWNCGPHACLVARSWVTGRYWYDEKDVLSFRTEMKEALKAEGYELSTETRDNGSRVMHQSVIEEDSPESGVICDGDSPHDNTFTVQLDDTFTVLKDTDDHTEIDLTVPEDMDLKDPKVSEEPKESEVVVPSDKIPRLMDLKLDTPPNMTTNQQPAVPRVTVERGLSPKES